MSEFFFLNPKDLPEEVRAELQKQNDLHHMNHVQSIHEIRDFMGDLNKEQLTTLRNLVGRVKDGTPEQNECGAYYVGRITQLLETKHGLCACGIDHDKDAANLLDEPRTAEEQDDKLDEFKEKLKEVKAPVAPKEPQPPITFTDHNDIMHVWKDGAWVRQDTPVIDAETELIGDPRDALLKEYGVMDLPAQFPKVVCAKDCGARWVSLNDRMKRAPDDCYGCKQKSAWG